MVLLKGADERGFVFHSSYEGRKARELAENPRAALLFHWQEPGRQVRVEGEVERIDEAESEAYFRTRPRGGQLAAWASTQSEPIGSREELEEQFQEIEALHAGLEVPLGGDRLSRGAGGTVPARSRREHAGLEVPLPPHWGGFRLVPESYEFWEHRDNRMHDRFRYRRDGGGVDDRAPLAALAAALTDDEPDVDA